MRRTETKGKRRGPPNGGVLCPGGGRANVSYFYEFFIRSKILLILYFEELERNLCLI